MSAASLLRSLSPSAMPGPVMPIDMAMRFYISHSPPLRGFLSSYEAQRHRKKGRAQRDQAAALRPCLSSQQRAAGCDGWGGKGLKKKVVFADTKGMSLTAIHVFSKNDDERGAGAVEELQFDLSDLESAAMELKISPVRTLALDFKQPSADYLDFRNRLIRNAVCLENCSLQERSLSGTVKVRNVGFEKSVQVRTTFDSWTTFSDVDCTFLNNVYGCPDTDTFAFVLDLPENIPPQHLVEFCICFRVQDQVFWDNNDGKNYVIKHLGWTGGTSSDSVEHKAAAESRGGGVKVLEMDLEQLGSPRMCSGFFPGWQNWSQANTAVPYW